MLRPFAMTLGLVLPAISFAAKPVVFTVQVIDAVTAQAVPNAEVRIPNTDGRRQVDPDSGLWEASMLYTFAGEALIFTKGMPVDVTVSAPGYVAVNFVYEMRPRKNVVIVPLQHMEEREAVDEADEDGVMIRWFKRTTTNQDDDA